MFDLSICLRSHPQRTIDRIHNKIQNRQLDKKNQIRRKDPVQPEGNHRLSGIKKRQGKKPDQKERILGGGSDEFMKFSFIFIRIGFDDLRKKRRLKVGNDLRKRCTNLVR